MTTHDSIGVRIPDFVRRESMTELESHLSELAAIYLQHGALVFPGLLRDEPDFIAYRRDIAKLANVLIEQVSDRNPALTLERAITELAAIDRPAVGKLFDLGTRPAKLLSAQRLRLHPVIMALTRMALGPDALIASPSQSDTLHILPPGAENFKYNLPPHQDYPYLLQSPTQITFWINFGEFQPDVGGVRFWAGSHRLGILRQRRNEHGQFEAAISNELLGPFPSYDCVAGVGDVVLMNSLTVHASIRNHTVGGSRVVQLFRYSDLHDRQSVAMRWASAEFRGAGLTFEKAHPDLALIE
jgi:hypothetical protein